MAQQALTAETGVLSSEPPDPSEASPSLHEQSLQGASPPALIPPPTVASQSPHAQWQHQQQLQQQLQHHEVAAGYRMAEQGYRMAEQHHLAQQQQHQQHQLYQQCQQYLRRSTREGTITLKPRRFKGCWGSVPLRRWPSTARGAFVPVR